MGLEIRIRYPDGNERVLAMSKDSVSVGRSEENDLALAFPFVSRRHCRFAREGSRVVVEDTGSTNGIVVNDEPLDRMTTQVLGPDDVIALGAVQLRVRIQPDAVPSAAPGAVPGAVPDAAASDGTVLELEDDRTVFTDLGGADAGVRPASPPGADPARPPAPPMRDVTATIWEIQTGIHRLDEIRIDDRRIGTQGAGVSLPTPPDFLADTPGAELPRAPAGRVARNAAVGLFGFAAQGIALATILAVLTLLLILVLS